MKYFDFSMSIEEAKSKYKELVKEFHPDHGGNEDICKEIISEFNIFCNEKVQNAFNKSEKTYDNDANVFANILKKIINFNCKIEIIGFWIYATESYEYREELKGLGFFYSASKKAWIFNGEAKKRMRSKYSLNDLRNIKGSKTLRNKEENLKLA